MSRAPRKPLGSLMDEDDHKLVAAVSREGGLGGQTPVARSKPASIVEGTPSIDQKINEVKKEEKEQRADTKKAGELRPTINQSSQLGQAIKVALESVDPHMRKAIKPLVVISDFLAENDEELAELFRKTNILQRR